MQPSVRTILDAATATGRKASAPMNGKRGFTVTIRGKTTSGTGAAVVNVRQSSDDQAFSDPAMGIGTLTLGVVETSVSFYVQAPVKFVQPEVASISGTGATVSVDVTE